MIRSFLKKHRPGRRRQKVYDFFVAYLVPGPIWRLWGRWYWGWNSTSACDECPECQRLEALNDNQH